MTSLEVGGSIGLVVQRTVTQSTKMIVMREIEVRPNQSTVVKAHRAYSACLAPFISDDRLNEPITAQITVHGREIHLLSENNLNIPTISMHLNHVQYQ